VYAVVNLRNLSKRMNTAKHRWFMPVILITQEAEIRRILVRRQPGQIVHQTLSQKYLTKKRGSVVAQGVGPECQPQAFF
jgi:hypothetical protein